jgi:putative hydrolase of the HAD superfamily
MDTILFDLDDTLIVEWKSADESFTETISRINDPIDPDEFIKTIRETARELWYQLPTIDFCRKIQISSWEGLWADFSGDEESFKKLREVSAAYRFETWHQALSKFNIHNPEIAAGLSLEFKRIRNTKHILFPETEAVLDKLRGLYKLGLITNGAPDLQWKKIDGGNLRQYFDCIVISGEHGYAKPDERLFDIAMKGLKSEKSGTLMVGDTLKSDIKGAQDYGMKTIWINRDNKDYKVNKVNKVYREERDKKNDRGNGDILEIKPDFEITSLSEIFYVLEQ